MIRRFKTKRLNATLLGLAVVALTLGAAGANAAELKVGDPAPSFEMIGSDGKTYKSEELNGKKAYVIAWFPKAFTGG